MWNAVRIFWVIGSIISLPFIMIYTDEKICDFDILYKHIDEFLKFCVAPQVIIYSILEDKLRPSGVVICEIVVSIFFLFPNCILFIFMCVTKLLQLLWHLFVKVFGKKEGEEE